MTTVACGQERLNVQRQEARDGDRGSRQAAPNQRMVDLPAPGNPAILLGLMLLTNLDATLVALTTFLGFYLLITGVLALVRVFVDRSTSRLWSVLSGIVGLLAGSSC
jgi:uncharacterized membrane protein HdeD (DUF308 family)